MATIRGILRLLSLMAAFAVASSFTALPAAVVVPGRTFTGQGASSSILLALPDGNDTQKNALPNLLAAGMLALSALTAPLRVVDMHPTLPVANAESSRVVGEIQGSGLVFKDTLKVESFDDPKVKGVTLYLSNFERPINERLSKDFFSDPSAAAVGCAKTGPVSIADNIETGKQGGQVFQESRSLLFKSLRVQRIYDQEHNTMVYVVFNTRLDKGDDSNKSRYQSAVCAVNLDEPGQSRASPQAASAPP